MSSKIIKTISEYDSLFHLMYVMILKYSEVILLSREKGEGDIMPVIIERIISIEQAETVSFIKKQQKELERLKAIEQRKNEGKNIHRKPIIEGLQRAGILDENGHLAAPYRDEE